MNARNILAAEKGLSLAVCIGVVASIVTTPLIIGPFLFGLFAYIQLRTHFQAATDERPRGSILPGIVALCSYGGAIGVMGAWISFVVLAFKHAHGAPVYYFRDEAMVVAVLTSPIVFGLAAWILTPFLLLAVVAIDPKAPSSGTRDKFVCALNLAQEIPVRRRLSAIAIAGLFLLGPAVCFVVMDHGAVRVLCGFAMCVCVVTFLPVASALLVATYLPMRDGLGSFYGRAPRIPSGLLAYAIVGAVVSVAAVVNERHWYHDDTAMTLGALGFSWFLVVLAFFGFWRAHQLRKLDVMREDAPPGRYALQVRVEQPTKRRWPEGSRLVAGPLSFRVPAGVSVRGAIDIKKGDVLTLVGEFEPASTSFRESADHPWPERAVLVAGTPEHLVMKSVERASWLAYGALSLSGFIASLLLFG